MFNKGFSQTDIPDNSYSEDSLLCSFLYDTLFLKSRLSTKAISSQKLLYKMSFLGNNLVLRFPLSLFSTGFFQSFVDLNTQFVACLLPTRLSFFRGFTSQPRQKWYKCSVIVITFVRLKSNLTMDKKNCSDCIVLYKSNGTVQGVLGTFFLQGTYYKRPPTRKKMSTLLKNVSFVFQKCSRISKSLLLSCYS